MEIVLTIEDDFFIDSEGYLVVAEPQHGGSLKIGKATEQHKAVLKAQQDRERELSSESTKAHILALARDAVVEFAYYQRREDEEMDLDRFNQAFLSGVVTVPEVVAAIAEQMVEWRSDLK